MCYFTLDFKCTLFYNVFHCEHKLTYSHKRYYILQLSLFTKQILRLLSLCVSIFTQVSATMKSTTQFSEKNVAFTVTATVHFGLWASSFLGYQCIEITSSSNLKTNFIRIALSKPQLPQHVKITRAKTKDGTIGTFPTQRSLTLKGFCYMQTAITIKLFKPYMYTIHYGNIYIYEWHSCAAFLYMYFLNQPTT